MNEPLSIKELNDIYFNAMLVGLGLIELASYGYYPLKGEENGFAWLFWYTEPRL